MRAVAKEKGRGRGKNGGNGEKGEVEGYPGVPLSLNCHKAGNPKNAANKFSLTHFSLVRNIRN